MRKLLTVTFLAAGMGATGAGAAAAQDFLFGPPGMTVGIFFGGAQPRASGGIFDFTNQELTVERDDYTSGVVGAEVGIRQSEMVDWVLGIGYEVVNIDSEFREYIGDDGLPILQTTSFWRTPLTAGVKVYPMGRGRHVSALAWIPKKAAPYVGGGAGWVWYEFSQRGEFVDYETLDIFRDRFTSAGSSALVYGAAGLDISLGRRWMLNLEGRYRWADAEFGQDFVGFDPIDLSGFRITVGAAVRL